MDRPPAVSRPTRLLALAALLLALTATLPGCFGGIYGGDPGPMKPVPPCLETIRGDWQLEATDGEPGPSPAPPVAGATRFSITRSNVLVGAPNASDLGAYQVLGSAGAAVELGGLGAAPLRILCNGNDKIQIDEAAPGSRHWFYRRVP